ncbi:MAG: hypothetical protein SO128_10260 [Clostridium cadaveris]|nr:hypothetical protein [Clostridium cadaveris]
MMNMPGTIHGAELSKEVRTLAIGLHLNISLGKPLTKASLWLGKMGSS